MYKIRLLKQLKVKHIRIPSIVPHPDRAGLAVVTMVRDEGAHIADWASFHLRAGVRKLIVYDNGSIDGTADILRAAVPPENLTLMPWAGAYVDDRTDIVLDRQCVAYSHAVMNFGPAFERLAFLDADEFLFPIDGHPDLMTAIGAVGGHAGIAVPWAMFGTNGHGERPDLPVWEAYTRRAAVPEGVLDNIKSIVDPAEIIAVGVHSCITRSLGRHVAVGDGTLLDPLAPRREGALASRNLQLNHYYTRSSEEFEAKIQRGPGGSADTDRYRRRLRKTWTLIHADTIEDRAILDFIARSDAPA
ncbi:MAG: glycosyltransferase family 92 protein [Pseudomonadota bacterium]